MKYNLKILETFEKAAKPFIKKYPSFKQDMQIFFEKMMQNPNYGISLGGGVRKIRVAITSKNKGKSSGVRVISYNTIISITEADIYLLTIYDKEKTDSITKEEIIKLLKKNKLL